MNKTNISWTDFSWNPITGCSAISDGCKNCYAKIVHERFSDTSFSEVVFHQERLNEPSKRKKASKIFLGSMTDLFQDNIPFGWLYEIMKVVKDNPQHTFQILTKRPERMRDFFQWLYIDQPANWVSSLDNLTYLPNLWIGVTAENQEQATNRIPILLEIPAAIRFVSIEPMIDSVNLGMLIIENIGNRFRIVYDPIMTGTKTLWDTKNLVSEVNINKIDWVIVGGETGSKSKAREMKINDVYNIYQQCKITEIPFFFKQYGAHKPNGSFEFESVQEFPKKDIRQG